MLKNNIYIYLCIRAAQTKFLFKHNKGPVQFSLFTKPKLNLNVNPFLFYCISSTAFSVKNCKLYLIQQ